MKMKLFYDFKGAIEKKKLTYCD